MGFYQIQSVNIKDVILIGHLLILTEHEVKAS